MGAFRYLADGLRNVVTGLGFGAEQRSRYSYCPLSQQEIEAAYRGSGIMRKIIDIPAFDAVRAGRDWQADKEQIDAIEAEEKRLGLWAKVRQAEILRGLGGGALILGAPGDPMLPVNPRGSAKSLAFIHVASRYHLKLGPIVENIEDARFGGPEWFELNAGTNTIRLHPSRVVCFKGDVLPAMISTSWEDQFWGESRVARVLEAVTNSDTAQTAFAALIKKARYTRIGIPNLSDYVATDEGEARLRGRIQNMSALEGGANATIYDAGDGTNPAETITDYQVTWSGIPEIMTAYDVRVAAVADIPMTRMFGRAAEGMNSSGDSQQKDWNRHVSARQELELRPCLEQVDVALIPSALGNTPPDIWWAFAPLDNPTEKEQADTFKTTMDAVTQVQNTGAIPDVAFAKGVQNLLSERAWMPGLDAALESLPEDVRFGITPTPNPTDPSAITADPAQAA